METAVESPTSPLPLQRAPARKRRHGSYGHAPAPRSPLFWRSRPEHHVQTADPLSCESASRVQGRTASADAAVDDGGTNAELHRFPIDGRRASHSVQPAHDVEYASSYYNPAAYGAASYNGLDEAGLLPLHIPSSPVLDSSLNQLRPPCSNIALGTSLVPTAMLPSYGVTTPGDFSASSLCLQPQPVPFPPPLPIFTPEAGTESAGPLLNDTGYFPFINGEPQIYLPPDHHPAVTDVSTTRPLLPESGQSWAGLTPPSFCQQHQEVHDHHGQSHYADHEHHHHQHHHHHHQIRELRKPFSDHGAAFDPHWSSALTAPVNHTLLNSNIQPQQDTSSPPTFAPQSHDASLVKTRAEGDHHLNRPQEALPARKRRGKFKSVVKREQTSQTRKMKACLRCRQQRVRCEYDPEDPGGVCLTCRNVSNSKQTIHHLPCLRYKITECTLYRAGKLGYTSRWQDMKVREITDWESTDTRMLVLRNTQELVMEGFVVILRPFRAQLGDKLHRSWFDQEQGVIKQYDLPAWAVESMHSAKEDFKTYTDKHAFECMARRLRYSDALVRKTYARAQSHLNNGPTETERVLMLNLLRLWFVSQHTLGSDYFENPEALGLEPHEDPSYPHPGKVPTPPLVNAQFDVIFTEALLKPYKKKVLEELQNMIKSNRPETFITLYLCTFILLHNFSLMLADRYRHARKHGVQSRYTLPDLVSSWHHSANVILAHYHYCNGDMDPMALDMKNRHRTRLANLTADEAEFLLQTRELVKEREKEFASVRDNDLADHEFYYVSQMFEKDWKPRDTVID